MKYYKTNKFPKIKDKFKIDTKNGSINYIFLREYSNTIKSPYHNRISQNLSGYEKDIYKFEHMLEEYKEKLNNIEENLLGNPEIDEQESRNLFYKEFFKNNKIQAMQNYLDGLQWLLDYYFNGKTYHKWYYLYNRSPLIKDLYNYILNYKSDFFKKSKKTLEKCCLINKSVDMLSPFEQLLYITPFDKKLDYINMFNEYSNINKVKDIVINIFKDHKALYPDIESISKNVFESKTNNDIDCKGAFYLNKCILNVIHDSNMINEQDVKETIRKIISIDDQSLQYISEKSETESDGYIKNYKNKLTQYDNYRNKS